MGAQATKGVVVSLRGDAGNPEFVHHVERLTEGTPYRLASAESGPGDVVRCLFVKRDERLAVGSGNFVDLLYRLQRSFELDGANQVPAGVAG